MSRQLYVGRERHRFMDSWQVAGESIKGPRRLENEDAFALCPRGAGVFDGVGGLPRGRAASSAAATNLELALAAPEPLTHLDAAVRQSGGATTALVVDWDRSKAWSVGDGWLLHVTSTATAQLVASDGHGNVISQCLGKGAWSAHEADLRVAIGESLLMCTDGVHKLLSADELARMVRGVEPTAAVAAILQRVVELGAPDNATVVVARRDA